MSNCEMEKHFYEQDSKSGNCDASSIFLPMLHLLSGSANSCELHTEQIPWQSAYRILYQITHVGIIEKGGANHDCKSVPISEFWRWRKQRGRGREGGREESL